MLPFRSLAFNAAFYLHTTLMAVAILPLVLLPRRAFMRVVQAWCASSLWLLKVVAGVRYEIRHRERLPPGSLLIAAKHQSTLETFALTLLLDDPAYVLKRELMWIPLVGWYMWRSGMVPVDRSAGSAALALMNEQARKEAQGRRQIVIFPEGTRKAPGAPPAYKFGAAHLYANLGVPCLPIALNTGLYWPRRQLGHRPGTAVIEFLEPIAPGLSREAFFAEVQASIERASARLLAEGQAELGLAPPVPSRASA